MRTTIALAVLFAAPLPTLAQTGTGEPPIGPLESRDPSTKRLPAGPLRSPAAMAASGGFMSVQANVDENGMNILNDAGNEPSIAVDPTAPLRMAVGWRQFGNIQSSFRQAGWAWSTDGGRTWSGMDIIEPSIFRSDPVLTADANGTFYYLSLEVTGGDFHCDVFTSDDAGQTWPVKNFAYGGDKAWIVADTTGGIGDGNLYQPWNVAGNMFFPNLFSRSIGGGASWEDPVPYDDSFRPARPVFGTLDVGPDGAVYVGGARNSSFSEEFWVVKSSSAQDAGSPIEFEQIVSVDMGGALAIGEEPNPAGLMGQINVSVDRSGGLTDGNVYVLGSIDPPGTDPMDIHLIRSEDGGLNWSEPVRINDDEGNDWQWFGTMSVAPTGRIDVVWNDTRESGIANMNRLYYSSSDDGGVTWSANEALSPPFDSHLGWPQQNKLGDYYDMISDAVGAHLIWAATFNGEQDVYYLRIGDYDCNGNGIGDEIDLADGTSGDCNNNGIPDECEIAAGTLVDENGNGIPDICDCAGDVTGDGTVDVEDLVQVILDWGPCGDPCPSDTDGNGFVDVEDLVAVILGWGECGDGI